jgi:ABC-type transporter Mla subunit MlaD
MQTCNFNQTGAADLEERARQTASSIGSTVADKARQATAYVGEKAERATEAVGAGMENLGSTIREHEPAAGRLHNAGEAVARKLENGGRYIEEQGLKGIGEDVTNLIRRNPIPALLIGVGIGLLVARMARR